MAWNEYQSSKRPLDDNEAFRCQLQRCFHGSKLTKVNHDYKPRHADTRHYEKGVSMPKCKFFISDSGLMRQAWKKEVSDAVFWAARRGEGGSIGGIIGQSKSPAFPGHVSCGCLRKPPILEFVLMVLLSTGVCLNLRLYVGLLEALLRLCLRESFVTSCLLVRQIRLGEHL